jgi:hypothetical protein
MRRIFAYIISLVALIFQTNPQAKGQDTLQIPLRINIGIEAIGPVSYFIDKKTLSLEGNVMVNLNEKYSVSASVGYLDYNYSQYNYQYLSNGLFAKAGVDINMLKPKKSMGIYWGGLGLRYGISRFRWEVPRISQSNYWGKAYSSLPPSNNWGHFLEISPGMRAQFIKNISMGWSVNLRMLLYTGTSEGMKPIYFPGFGNAGNRISTGFSYFIVWNIPYKKIRVIIKKEEPEEEEDTEDMNNQQQQGTGTGTRNRTQTDGFRQQSSTSPFR